MPKSSSKPNTSAAAARLREIIWDAEEGQLLGSEEDIIQRLNVSRPTVRQVARLLEFEGLLQVRRGNNGGYFAARPSIEVLEQAVSAYLKMMVVDYEELTEIASALWVIAATKAASTSASQLPSIINQMKERVAKIPDDATFDDILEIDDEIRSRLFETIDSPYVELIFQINRIFSEKNFPSNPSMLDDSPEHRQYVRSWRSAKIIELEAIASGDASVVKLAARYTRDLLHKRLWGHDSLL